jgi:hypothetical protein
MTPEIRPLDDDSCATHVRVEFPTGGWELHVLNIDGDRSAFWVAPQHGQIVDVPIGET